MGDLLEQLPVLVGPDFREEGVTIKLLEDTCDEEPPGSCCVHHLLGQGHHTTSQTLTAPPPEAWAWAWAVPGRASCLRSPTPGRPAPPAPSPPAAELSSSPGPGGVLLLEALCRRGQQKPVSQSVRWSSNQPGGAVTSQSVGWSSNQTVSRGQPGPGAAELWV